MPTLNIYLNFDGTCEAAFDFYKSIFGGEFDSISRFSEMPPDPKFSVDDADKDKIMHVSLPISQETVLMGSDTAGGFGPPLVVGNNFSISVYASNREESDRLFAALSDGGGISMPMGDTFWESYFGMCTDKFGIQWMISCDNS